MRASSSLSEQQRAAAVALFETGAGERVVARQLGVSRSAVRRLHDRWQLRGREMLVDKPDRQSFSFEFKLAVVQRFLAGESKADLAREFGLSSPKLLENWARIYRNEGEEGLRPKRRGRPKAEPTASAGPESALAQLRRENARLRAENALLGKVLALRAQQRQ